MPDAIRSSAVRRRKAGVLVVGATEPEVRSWLRAAGHETQAVPTVDDALTVLEEEPVELVLADAEPGGLDADAVCRVLRADPRLGDAWLLSVVAAGKARAAKPAAHAGADDRLVRPLPRPPRLARAPARLRAGRQRSHAAALPALLPNVPPPT